MQLAANASPSACSSAAAPSANDSRIASHAGGTAAEAAPPRIAAARMGQQRARGREHDRRGHVEAFQPRRHSPTRITSPAMIARSATGTVHLWWAATLMAYWRAMCMRSSASGSWMSSPLTSIVTSWMVPVNLKGLA